MRPLRAFLRRLAGLRSRRRRDAEFAAELACHLAENIAENLSAGMDAAEARRQALLRLGGVAQTEEAYRDRRGLPWLEAAGRDVRYAVRLLADTPWITAAALLSLALGIGANTAMFGITNSLLLRSLPVRDPQQLVEIEIFRPGARTQRGVIVTNPIWEQVRDRQRSLAAVAATGPTEFDLASGGRADTVQGLFVSGGFFPLLGLRPALGRLVGTGDDYRGCGGVADLSYGFWQARFGGSRSVIGQPLSLAGHAVPIIGVAPAGFYGTDVGRQYQIAVPICAEARIGSEDEAASRLDDRSDWWLRIVGRLAPGESRERAQAGLNAVAPAVFRATEPQDWPARLRQAYLGWRFSLAPAATGLSPIRAEYERPLVILMAIVALVLLIACTNLAGLMLARAAARQKELGLRSALGATRCRLLTQALTESVLLGGGGAILGTLLAWWAEPLIVGMIATRQEPVFLDVALDGRVLAFTLTITAATVLLFGLWPAWRASRAAPLAALQTGARGASVRGPIRWLVAAQTALAVPLMLGAVVFVASFRNLATLDPGFSPRRVLLVSMDVQNAHLAPAARLNFYRQALARIAALPGVVAASQTWFTPLSHFEWFDDVTVAGDRARSSQEPQAFFNWITSGYFAAMRTPLVAGRDFGVDDGAGAPVAIVNQAFAQRFFPDGRAVGRFFGVPEQKLARVEIVGVARDSKYDSLREQPQPFVYYPLATRFAEMGVDSNFEIRSAGPAAALTAPVTEAIGNLDPVASLQFTTLRRQVEDSIARPRLLALLAGFFGVLALLLTAIGLYGVLGFQVTRRTREIGIRVALGAPRRRVLTLVLREVALLLAIGAAAGGLLAWWLVGFVGALVFGLAPRDLTTMAAALGALLAAAAMAAYWPVRRAMAVEPAATLRSE